MSNKNEIRKRAETLVSQMTVKEKVGQLCQRLYGFSVYELHGEEIAFTEEFYQEVEACGGLGTLYGLYRSDPWSGRDYSNGLHGQKAVEAYNLLQKYVLEHSRLSIPVMMSSECPHGHQALDGYLLPVNLASGASFAPEVLKEAATVCARQLKAMGVDLALVSALDILRDPRWGRSEECFGEDPYLASTMAKAVVEGMQNVGIGVVAKHFCGQGETTGGVNASAARIGERELREIHLPAAKACCEAGVKGIMAAYNEIDGIYCHANGPLLRGTLRKEFGFDGLVMADGIAIDQLDVMTGDNVVSAATALKAGVDIGLWDKAYSRLEEALEAGLVSAEELDEAVRRVLELKLELGLFDKPYLGMDGERTAELPQALKESSGEKLPQDLGERSQEKISQALREPSQEKETAFSYEKYPQSKRLALESLVLLKNDGGLLPLENTRQKIAVIGPNADDIYRQIGDYSPPLGEGCGRTIWQGMAETATEASLRLSDGENEEKAAELSERSDVVLLVLGGSSSRFEGAVFDNNGAAISQQEMAMDCGEGVDSSVIRLPGSQQELFDTVRRRAKKLITVIIAGRPYAIPEIAERTDALLYCFYPGPMGGEAIGEAILGIASPTGRLPVSLPRSAGQLPVYYNYRKSYQAMRYYDEREGALYSFGEGFGYSDFSYEDMKVETSPEGILIQCTVENTGAWEDAIVLQCYRSIQASEVVPRIRELKGFLKVRLKKGEKRRVSFPVGREFFSVFGREGSWKEEGGPIRLLLMDSGRLIWECEITDRKEE